MTGVELLDVRQAAAELGMRVRTVQRRIAAGTIKAERLGTHTTAPYVISRTELDRVKREQKQAS